MTDSESDIQAGARLVCKSRVTRHRRSELLSATDSEPGAARCLSVKMGWGEAPCCCTDLRSTCDVARPDPAGPRRQLTELGRAVAAAFPQNQPRQTVATGKATVTRTRESESPLHWQFADFSGTS